VLRVWTEDAFSGQMTSDEDIPSRVLKFPFVNPLTGPFFIEQAEPGDTLAIHFIDIRPSRGWGVSTTIPYVGSLTSTKHTVSLQDPLAEKVWIYPLDREKLSARFRARDSTYEVDMPIKPFLGTVGVASSNEVRSSRVPDQYGGNMDTSEACAGTTLYLGVNVRGAFLGLGDAHYLQGQGEVCGAAIEGAADSTVGIGLLKDYYCSWPRFENDEYIMTAGSCRPLDDAFKIAVSELVRWVSTDYGLSLMDAYQLVSQVNESVVANMVNPNYTIVAKVPKRFLPGDKRPMGDTHAKLKRMADEYRFSPGT
jgi:acetamidase/formamidase